MVRMYIGIRAIWLVAALCALIAAPAAFPVMDDTGEGTATGDVITVDDSMDDVTDDMAEVIDDIEDDWSEEYAEDEDIGFREDKVYLDFKEADIRDVLRVFARKAKVNIVPSQRVQGTVTVKLSDVQWERALQLILEQHNFVLQKDEDGIYKVFTQEEIGAVPLETRVYRLSYAEASVAKTIIAPLLTPDRGQIESDVNSNKLIISDVPNKHETFSRVIAELDARIKQVSIEVRVLETASGREKDVGIDWSVMKGWKLTAGSLEDSTEIVNIEEEIEALYKVTDSHQDLTPKLGELSSDQYVTSYYGDPEMQTPWKDFKTVTGRTAILSAADFSLVLSALLAETDTELISNPRIATVDNRSAEIKVTRQIPVPQYSYNDQTGTYEIKSFEYKDIGITLKVTPHINQDDYITLEVKPEVTTQFGNKTFVISGGSIDIPVIDVRSAETKVIVKSRETLAIGGLVSEDESKIVKKLPVLGDLPIISPLFKHTSTVKQKKDLIFFITPTLVETEGTGVDSADALGTSSDMPVEVVGKAGATE